MNDPASFVFVAMVFVLVWAYVSSGRDSWF
jgi:hypothetical protein